MRKTPVNKRNSAHNLKFTGSDRQTLNRTVAKHHKSTVSKNYQRTELTPLRPTCNKNYTLSFTKLEFMAGLPFRAHLHSRPIYKDT